MRLRPVFILGTSGKYREKDQSKAFPFLPMKEIERFLLNTEAENHTAHMRSFHEWVRTTLAPKYAKSHKGAKNGKRK